MDAEEIAGSFEEVLAEGSVELSPNGFNWAFDESTQSEEEVVW
jgi:hypothetical protein